jgi:ribosomal protein L23
MLLIPRVSEKAYGATLRSTYVFDVPATAVKATVKAAVEAEFKDVKVGDVRLVTVKGKAKNVMLNKRSRGKITRTGFKKAYVTLLEGKIAIEAFDAKDSEEDKKDKAAAGSAQSSKVNADDVTKEKGGAKKKTGLFARRRTGRRGDK